jgi:membrane protein YdbS with pleckstrin-like domain
MSSYVDSVLADGERIVYRAHISHWKFFLSYLLGALFVAAAVAAYANGSAYNMDSPVIALVLLVVGVVIVLSAAIRRSTTELVLTNRRIITKRGLVARNTVEMNLNKVESLHVDQSLMGRLFNYGDVTVVGTGASLEPLRGISSPLELRKNLGAVAEGVEAKASS